MRTLFIVLVALILAAAVHAQPIFDYVNAPDPAYEWEMSEQAMLPTGAQVQKLSLTSQVWQGLTWTHRVQVVTPPQMNNSKTAIMLITGGSPGQGDLMSLSLVANAASAPLVILGDIPNQPLFDGRTEDEIIAYTFQKYLETGDETWPLLFPMTKAAVQCMRAIEEYTASWQQPVENFYVTGASKRGWTTWFTAEVAPEQVVGIAPMVYDNLNLPAQMEHQLEAWGDYSQMIDEYTELGLPDLIQTEKGAELGAWVDPYTYTERATMPKLVISGTNDQYWPLDAASFYFDELPDPKYLLYVPNSGHGLEDLPRVLNTQVAFYLVCTGALPTPQITWEFEEAESLQLRMSADPTPSNVQIWTAHSETRDFREAEWSSTDATTTDSGWTGQVEYPDEGYTAIFGEIVYDVNGRPAYLSTSVKIIGPLDGNNKK
ncbi:MAG: PhoPQ-activated pathogenicity-related family protein [Armatimonadota bacterium]